MHEVCLADEGIYARTTAFPVLIVPPPADLYADMPDLVPDDSSSNDDDSDSDLYVNSASRSGAIPPKSTANTAVTAAITPSMPDPNAVL